MCNVTPGDITEQRLVRAYTRLFLVPKGEDGSRRVSLARFGNYEVSLIEVAQDDAAGVPQFWLELYAHDIQRGIDSCACDDLEQAAVAAAGLVAQASMLDGCADTFRH